MPKELLENEFLRETLGTPLHGERFLAILDEAVFCLPGLLNNPSEWSGSVYEDFWPHVQFVSMPWGDGELALHQLQPTNFQEVHFHARPLAVWLVEDGYDMGFASQQEYCHPWSDDIELQIKGVQRLRSGDRYTMIDPRERHYVQPSETALSVVYFGPYWYDSIGEVRDSRTLDQVEISAHLELFREALHRYEINVSEESILQLIGHRKAKTWYQQVDAALSPFLPEDTKREEAMYQWWNPIAQVLAGIRSMDPCFGPAAHAPDENIKLGEL